MPIREWKRALNQFAILFRERVSMRDLFIISYTVNLADSNSCRPKNLDPINRIPR